VTRAGALASAVVFVLVAAGIYELLIAVGTISIGSEPGMGAPGDTAVSIAALAAMLVGAVAAGAGVARPRASWIPGAVGTAAAALVAVRLYTYDPYYAPTLRRMSDGGLVAPGWVFFLVAFAVVGGVLARIGLRAGWAWTAMTLFVCLGTFLFEGAGH
jgi:hypothetical protein